MGSNPVSLSSGPTRRRVNFTMQNGDVRFQASSLEIVSLHCPPSPFSHALRFGASETGNATPRPVWTRPVLCDFRTVEQSYKRMIPEQAAPSTSLVLPAGSGGEPDRPADQEHPGVCRIYCGCYHRFVSVYSITMYVIRRNS